MTTRLQLISHASTAATARAAFPGDEPLDPRGLRRAEALAGRVTGTRSSLTGPELRCTQTAKALGLTAMVDPSLRDWDSGRWSGRTLAETEAREPEAVREWLADPAATPHGGESILDLIERVTAWLSGLTSGSIAAITHPAVIRAAVVHAVEAPPARFWHIDVEPLAGVFLSGRAGRWRLRYVSADDRGHHLSE
ncbi:histidine phosphatase family protein [Actinoallomurus vinaceus]|uniref:Histidine phosphatase family protein n=1 Tax=Actinoallomurus vinaceus TaxID=1080074 RepID=A0ABP8UER2_9ACTN